MADCKLRDEVGSAICTQCVCCGLTFTSCSRHWDRRQLCAAQLLEINLIQTPQVADAILANGVLTHYDRPRCLPHFHPCAWCFYICP